MEIIPKDYTSKLGVKETEKAIELLRDYFQEKFSQKLNLHRVSAPLFVRTDSGLNDGLQSLIVIVRLFIPLQSGREWHLESMDMKFTRVFTQI